MRVLTPASPFSLDIANLFNGLFILSCFILLLIVGLVSYALGRYRARPGGTEVLHQQRGNRALEIAWTVLPLITVGVIFFFTVKVMYSTAPDYVPPSPDIQITGHQWWWEVRYANGAYGANEIHIPVGSRVTAWILASDVIHNFWVPELGPKMDAIPGRTNALWLEANHPGTYLGACAEYCGTQHAWMLIRVIAQPAAEYRAWVAAQALPAPAPAGGDAARGKQLIEERTCINCHAIAGTNAMARVGPDLSHVASRETLGAGIVRNTPDNLAHWIRDPNSIKPGLLMPNLNLSDDEVQAVTAYLETLR